MGHIKETVRPESCSNCGEGFTCGAARREERCWCDALPHLPLTAIEGRGCLCLQCLSDAIQSAPQLGDPVDDFPLNSNKSRVPVPAAASTHLEPPGLLLEGEDYYSEGGVIVFTASYHRRRGYCCESGCRHCPFKD